MPGLSCTLTSSLVFPYSARADRGPRECVLCERFEHATTWSGARACVFGCIGACACAVFCARLSVCMRLRVCLRGCAGVVARVAWKARYLLLQPDSRTVADSVDHSHLCDLLCPDRIDRLNQYEHHQHLEPDRRRARVRLESWRLEVERRAAVGTPVLHIPAGTATSHISTGTGRVTVAPLRVGACVHLHRRQGRPRARMLHKGSARAHACATVCEPVRPVRPRVRPRVCGSESLCLYMRCVRASVWVGV